MIVQTIIDDIVLMNGSSVFKGYLGLRFEVCLKVRLCELALRL